MRIAPACKLPLSLRLLLPRARPRGASVRRRLGLQLHSSRGDFLLILAAQRPEVWQSDGALLQHIHAAGGDLPAQSQKHT